MEMVEMYMDNGVGWKKRLGVWNKYCFTKIGVKNDLVL